MVITKVIATWGSDIIRMGGYQNGGEALEWGGDVGMGGGTLEWGGRWNGWGTLEWGDI